MKEESYAVAKEKLQQLLQLLSMPGQGTVEGTSMLNEPLSNGSSLEVSTNTEAVALDVSNPAEDIPLVMDAEGEVPSETIVTTPAEDAIEALFDTSGDTVAQNETSEAPNVLP